MKRKKIFFLTRSYLPDLTGGTIIRAAQVKYLNSDYEVIVITPNYKSNEIQILNGIHYIPFGFYILPYRIHNYLEKFGITEDYLDFWIWNALKYLMSRLKSEDIIFATSGGELGMIKLGSLLKQKFGCPFVINFHDPLDYSRVNGMKINNKYHVDREKSELKYISNADAIITSSEYYADSLRCKYPSLSTRIVNNYFGYINNSIPKTKKLPTEKITVLYGGAFSPTQSPEILAETISLTNYAEAYFIGNFAQYKPLAKYINHPAMHFIPYLDHDKYIKFLTDNIDIGFLCLSNAYFGACVPSKLYECINLGLPVLGALPPGDAMDLINNKGYGIACRYDDVNNIRHSLSTFLDLNQYNIFRENILKDREKWSMKVKIKDVIEILNSLHS